jgi:hypothetical protein
MWCVLLEVHSWTIECFTRVTNAVCSRALRACLGTGTASSFAALALAMFHKLLTSCCCGVSCFRLLLQVTKVIASRTPICTFAVACWKAQYLTMSENMAPARCQLIWPRITMRLLPVIPHAHAASTSRSCQILTRCICSK